jgi:hypothetical protein
MRTYGNQNLGSDSELASFRWNIYLEFLMGCHARRARYKASRQFTLFSGSSPRPFNSSINSCISEKPLFHYAFLLQIHPRHSPPPLLDRAPDACQQPHVRGAQPLPERHQPLHCGRAPGNCRVWGHAEKGRGRHRGLLVHGRKWGP